MAAPDPVPTDPVEAYNAVRDGSLKYATYDYSPEGDKIIVKETGLHDPDAGRWSESEWQKFLDHLKDDECRYNVYDFVYPRTQGGEEVMKKKFLFSYTLGPGRCGANISEKKVRDTLGILMMSCVVPPRGGLVIQEVVKRMERKAK